MIIKIKLVLHINAKSMFEIFDSMLYYKNYKKQEYNVSLRYAIVICFVK